MLRIKADTSAFRKNMQLLARQHETRTRELLERVGKLTVEFLRGYTNEKKLPKPVLPEEAAAIRIRTEARFAGMLNEPDPKKRAENRRRVDSMIRRQISRLKRNRVVRARGPFHPGHWADRTRKLRDSYGYSVSRVSRGWALIIYNQAPHAHLVEERDGFYVVRGVTAKGGPVDRALGQALRELAPEWKKVS